MNPIKIIFEDSNLLVLDKPSGITVNRSDTTASEQTVQDFVDGYLKLPKVISENPFLSRAGIVHRIDKETSGILLVAKNEESFLNLQSQFKQRIVSKSYVALVHGHVKPDEADISVPIGRLAWNRKRFGVVAGGKEAITHYKVIEEMQSPYTLLELFPKTGRTHQIRVHLKYLNHPIFGDEFYAGRKTSRNDRKILNRFFLHAQKITFIHPKTGEQLSFESELPLELAEALEKIKKVDFVVKN